MKVTRSLTAASMAKPESFAQVMESAKRLISRVSFPGHSLVRPRSGGRQVCPGDAT
jgi:hypothetical protein